jgi:ATP/maltotriose-dependent transcriptional regulator MalT
MQDEVGLARSLLAESKAMMAELGVTMHTAVSHDEAFVAMAAGDLGGAEAVLRAGYERLDEMGEKALLATTAAMLAHVLEEQGRAEEAWAFSDAAQVTAADDDLSVQIMWRAVRARLLARRGAIPQAKRMSAEAVRLAERTDWLTDHADALISHAQVLRMAGDRGGAEDACDTAVALYSEKGNRVGIRRARAQFGDHVPA